MYNVFVMVSIEIGQFFWYTLIANAADRVISDSDRKAASVCSANASAELTVTGSSRVLYSSSQM